MPIIRKVMGIAVALLSVALAAAAIVAFRTIRFWVNDGLCDAREMMGDGPQPSWWHDFFYGGWVLAYLPVAILFLSSILFIPLAVNLFRNRTHETVQPAQEQ